MRTTYVGDRAETKAATGRRAERGGRGQRRDETCDRRARSKILRYSMNERDS